MAVSKSTTARIRKSGVDSLNPSVLFSHGRPGIFFDDDDKRAEIQRSEGALET